MDGVALVHVALMRTPILATHLIMSECMQIQNCNYCILYYFWGIFVIIADDVTD